MTSRASLKLFLRNVLFFDNISVLKVYSKSFVYNAFNDFARYSPHPSFICSVKRDTRTQGHCQTVHQWRPVSRRDWKNRYNCAMYHIYDHITDCFYTKANSNNNNNFLCNLSANYCIPGNVILTLIKLNS